jgi:hypothetical protein
LNTLPRAIGYIETLINNQKKKKKKVKEKRFFISSCHHPNTPSHPNPVLCTPKHCFSLSKGDVVPCASNPGEKKKEKKKKGNKEMNKGKEHK